jgi:hypothetical protein
LVERSGAFSSRGGAVLASAEREVDRPEREHEHDDRDGEPTESADEESREPPPEPVLQPQGLQAGISRPRENEEEEGPKVFRGEAGEESPYEG